MYKPFNVLLLFVHILFKISMSVFIKHICHFLVVSLPVFGISVKVFKIYPGLKKGIGDTGSILGQGRTHIPRGN